MKKSCFIGKSQAIDCSLPSAKANFSRTILLASKAFFAFNNYFYCGINKYKHVWLEWAIKNWEITFLLNTFHKKRIVLYSLVIMKWPYKLLSSDSYYSINFRSYTSFQAESTVKDLLDSRGNRREYRVHSVLVSWETRLWESTFQQNALKLLHWTWAEEATRLCVSLLTWEWGVLSLSAGAMTRIKSP